MLIKNDFFSYKNRANLQLFLIKTKKKVAFCRYFIIFV